MSDEGIDWLRLGVLLLIAGLFVFGVFNLISFSLKTATGLTTPIWQGENTTEKVFIISGTITETGTTDSRGGFAAVQTDYGMVHALLINENNIFYSRCPVAEGESIKYAGKFTYIPDFMEQYSEAEFIVNRELC